MRRWGLATQIVLPFLALFAALLIVLAVVLAYEVLYEVEEQIKREQRIVLGVTNYLGSRVNEKNLRGIRSLTGGENETYTSELVVLPGADEPMSTFPKQSDHGRNVVKDLAVRYKEKGFIPETEQGKDAFAYRRLGDDVYLILYRSGFHSGKQYHYFLLYPQKGIHAAQNRILWRILGISALGLGLMALLGLLVAGRISRPVKKLASAAETLAGGGLEEEVDVSADRAGEEIAVLAKAFQSMVESLRASQKKLIHHERLAATGRLAASVAHEIRNPLTAMRMTVQTLSERPELKDDKTTAEAMRLLEEEIDRLALTVDELLTYARPRPADRKPTDLNVLVGDTIKFLNRQFRHARVEVDFQADESMPKDLNLDADKIRQLLVNLLLNGLQAVVRDGTIIVSAKLNEDKNAVLISVKDNGSGIPLDVREKVFEPFVSTKSGGGGLGLAVAKQVAEEHDGTIRFETKTKEEGDPGTTFFVSLPV